MNFPIVDVWRAWHLDSQATGLSDLPFLYFPLGRALQVIIKEMFYYKSIIWVFVFFTRQGCHLHLFSSSPTGLQ